MFSIVHVVENLDNLDRDIDDEWIVSMNEEDLSMIHIYTKHNVDRE